MVQWSVIESKAVMRSFDQLSKYITTMERQGWKLAHVDNGTLYFRKDDDDDAK